MSQDARIFLVVAVIALVYLVIIPLIVRRKRIALPTVPEEQEQSPKPVVGGKAEKPGSKRAA